MVPLEETGAGEPGRRRATRPPRALRLNRRTFAPDQLLVMAVVDTVMRDRAAAMERVHAVVAEGADIVDIGGRPGRPGDEVEVREEIRHTIPFIAAVRDAYPDVVISVEAWRYEVGREACAAGADLLNDSGGGRDARLAEVAAEFGAGLVCSHAGNLRPGTPGGTLAQAARAVDAGADPARILIAPAGGFGDDPWPTQETTRRLTELVATGWPVVVSRPDEDFAGKTSGTGVDQRLAGPLAATAVFAWLGARVFRVRHVRETRRVLSMVAAVRGDIPPAYAVRGLA